MAIRYNPKGKLPPLPLSASSVPVVLSPLYTEKKSLLTNEQIETFSQNLKLSIPIRVAVHQTANGRRLYGPLFLSRGALMDRARYEACFGRRHLYNINIRAKEPTK